MNLSCLFGKEIISTDEKIKGRVLSVCIKENEIEGYICFDEREREFFAEAKGAKICGEQLLFERAQKVGRGRNKIRLGLPVYSSVGKFLGLLTDVNFCRSRISFIKVGKTKYPCSRVTFGDGVIIKDEYSIAEAKAKDMFIGAVISG